MAFSPWLLLEVMHMHVYVTIVQGTADCHKAAENANVTCDAGIVERVVISTSGEFSCPVQCGMLFMANCKIPQWAAAQNPQMFKALQVILLALRIHNNDSPTALTACLTAKKLKLYFCPLH